MILTGSRHGTASACLPLLARHPDIDVAMVVYCRSQFVNRRRRLRVKLRKVRQIGVGGAIAGYVMRSWYEGPPTEDLESLAARFDVPFRVSPRTNADETVELFTRSKAELGLSLGNGLIYPKVFRVPRYGMINVHGELLPRFQGAASVIWAIHDGVTETGFSIHEVDRSIDTGRILYQEKFPIRFQQSLRETVRHNVAETARRLPPALARVVADYPSFAEKAVEQGEGRRYTTPTLGQFWQMRRRHRSLRDGADAGDS